MIKAAKLILAFVGLCLATGFLWWKFFGQGHVKRAEELVLRTNMASLVMVEEGYHDQYGEYTDDFEELGYVPEGKLQVKFYLDKDEIPPLLRSSISEKDLPFTAKDDYQILGILSDNSGKEIFWKLRKGHDLEKINSDR